MDAIGRVGLGDEPCSRKGTGTGAGWLNGMTWRATSRNG